MSLPASTSEVSCLNFHLFTRFFRNNSSTKYEKLALTKIVLCIISKFTNTKYSHPDFDPFNLYKENLQWQKYQTNDNFISYIIFSRSINIIECLGNDTAAEWRSCESIADINVAELLEIQVIYILIWFSKHFIFHVFFFNLHVLTLFHVCCASNISCFTWKIGLPAILNTESNPTFLYLWKVQLFSFVF